MQSIKFHLPPGPAQGICQSLIDQDIYIGDDPIGRACTNKETEFVWVMGYEISVCDDCLEELKTLSRLHPGVVDIERPDVVKGSQELMTLTCNSPRRQGRITPCPSAGPLAGPHRPKKTQ